MFAHRGEDVHEIEPKKQLENLPPRLAKLGYDELNVPDKSKQKNAQEMSMQKGV